MSQLFLNITSAVALFVILGSAPATKAYTPAATEDLAPYVNGDTFAAIYLDVAKISESDLADNLVIRTMLQNIAPHSQGAMLDDVTAFVAGLRNAGVESAYVLIALSDIHRGGGPIVVLPTSDSRDAKRLAEKLRGTLAAVAPTRSDPEVRSTADGAVLVGSPATVNRYEHLQQSERADLLQPLGRMVGDGAAVAGVFCPGADFRRVVRQLWPDLPSPFAPLRGELAERWIHFEVAVTSMPELEPHAALQATDEEAADTFVNLLQSLPDAADSAVELGNRRHELSQVLNTIVESLAITKNGKRVEIELPSDQQRLVKLQDLAGRATHSALESTRRNQRINKFKQLALSILNYDAVNSHLPASAAIRSADGKPLLSWRVAILPFLEEGELYKQFHLDEPWDSPHNQKLVAKMPAIFMDPEPKLAEIAREGKTTYQVPVAPGTVFDRDEGTTYREITDGTSKTIMIVEVAPENAVAWTKPEDWQVDLEKPLRGVARSDRDYFIATYCDGSVQVIPVTADEKTLRANLTRAGQEVTDRP